MFNTELNPLRVNPREKRADQKSTRMKGRKTKRPFSFSLPTWDSLHPDVRLMLTLEKMLAEAKQHKI